MIELIAKIGPDRGVELVEHRSGKAHKLIRRDDVVPLFSSKEPSVPVGISIWII